MTRYVFWLLAVAFLFGLLSNQQLVAATGDTEEGGNDDGDGEFRGDVDHDVDAEQSDEEHIKISAVKHVPYLMMVEGASPSDVGNEAFEGVVPDILKVMCEKEFLSCDYRIQLPPDGNFGLMDNQGNWNGMIGQIVNNDVEIAAGAITITEDRKYVVDFSDPFEQVSLTIVVNAEDSVSTLAELLSNEDITLGVINGGSSMTSLRSQSSEPLSLLWPKIDKMEGSTVGTTAEGMERVRAGGYAMVVETSDALYYTNRYCSLMTIEETFLPSLGYGFAFKKQSAYLDKFNRGLEELKNDGSLQEIHDQWYSATCGARAVLLSWGILLMALLLSVVGL